MQDAGMELRTGLSWARGGSAAVGEFTTASVDRAPPNLVFAA
jgi:hypothetical protein